MSKEVDRYKVIDFFYFYSCVIK